MPQDILELPRDMTLADFQAFHMTRPDSEKWELIEGEHPVGSLKGRSAMAKIASADLRPSDIGAGLAGQLLTDLLRRMLDANPELRPSALEVARQLQEVQLRSMSR